MSKIIIRKQHFLRDVKLFFLEHKEKIKIAIRASSIVGNFMREKPMNAMKNLIDLVMDYDDLFFRSDNFFSPTNGWQLLFEGTSITQILLPMLEKYPIKNIKGYDPIQIIVIPNNWQLGVHTDRYAGGGYANCYLYYNAELGSREDIQKFIIDELFKEFNSTFVEVTPQNDGRLSLAKYFTDDFRSEKTEYYSKYIKSAIDKNIKRSILYYGPPGTGKTCLVYSILKDLNLKTLKINSLSLNNDFNFIKFLIRSLSIEAVVFDDLDHFLLQEGNILLELLSEIRKDVKVVFATVNSRDKFHKAVLRPGRFDRIVEIKELDTNVIEKTLGTELFKIFGRRVKHWPIAYINELKESHILNDQNLKETEEIFKSLEDRVKEQQSLPEDQNDFDEFEE